MQTVSIHILRRTKPIVSAHNWDLIIESLKIQSLILKTVLVIMIEVLKFRVLNFQVYKNLHSARRHIITQEKI